MSSTVSAMAGEDADTINVGSATFSTAHSGDHNFVSRSQSGTTTADGQICDREWNNIATHLAEYAYRVLRGWIVTGAIFGHVRKATGIQLPWQAELREPDTAEELAGVTIAAALKRFRVVLDDHQWDPSRGTCIETYFIGQCLFRFPNEYRRWLREQHRGSPENRVPINEIENLRDPSIRSDPEAVTLLVMQASAVLAALTTSRHQSTVILHALGYSHQDIACHLGVTPKAIEMTLYRIRRLGLPRP
ncbi:RNA polymerase sigma factor [Nocardia brasiliensis]|uniref:RNA polymerase sigma factor n=1 Tax=Nocardia brasiliensis TaxID=37326 RepID=UPI002454810E|nr:sigma factor-like helix-turn-helix DNA-binding protein [Nocardia brasiliensis]